MTREQLIVLNQADESLTNIQCKVRKETSRQQSGYFLNSGIIRRRQFHSRTDKPYPDQMVTPLTCRNDLLALSHDIPLSGHSGQDKTRNRLLAHYIWPRNLESCEKPMFYLFSVSTDVTKIKISPSKAHTYSCYGDTFPKNWF